MSYVTGDMTSAVEAAFAASTPDAAPTTTVETTAPSATETATPVVSQAAPETTEGPVAYPRFKEVNDGYQATKKELEALQWAKGLDPHLTRAFADLQERAKFNPLVWTEELEAVRDHPILGPQLRSWAARTLGTRTASRPAETVEDTGPEPDLQFEDGRRAYSAEQQHKREQWLLGRMATQMDERITPLAERQNRTEAEKQMVAIRAQATVDARSEIDALKAQPQFEEHRKDIAAVMEANPALNLRQAWAQVFTEKVIPKIAGQQAATVNKKVQAGSANPARPSGAAASTPTDFAEALSAYYPRT